MHFPISSRLSVSSHVVTHVHNPHHKALAPFFSRATRTCQINKNCDRTCCTYSFIQLINIYMISRLLSLVGIKLTRVILSLKLKPNSSCGIFILSPICLLELIIELTRWISQLKLSLYNYHLSKYIAIIYCSPCLWMKCIISYFICIYM